MNGERGYVPYANLKVFKVYHQNPNSLQLTTVSCKKMYCILYDTRCLENEKNVLLDSARSRYKTGM